MRVTILETGRPPEPLRGVYPDYPEMFAALIGDAAPDFSFEAVSILDGTPTPAVYDTEAILITGSAAGAYEDHPWIEPLEAFIRACAAANIPQVGICFGHQIMAKALGGHVRKSPRGWGVGRHFYNVVEQARWMDPPLARFALSASHQDQVEVLPPGARVLARSDHTDFAALAYDHTPAISFQGHPEMPDSFVAALYGVRRGGPLSEAQVDDALRSLRQPSDAATIARWIAAFFRAHAR